MTDTPMYQIYKVNLDLHAADMTKPILLLMLLQLLFPYDFLHLLKMALFD